MNQSIRTNRNRLRRATLVALSLAVSASGFLASAGTASAASPDPAGTVSRSVPQNEREASLAHWTPSRMAAATEGRASMPAGEDQATPTGPARPEGPPGSGLPSTGPARGTRAGAPAAAATPDQAANPVAPAVKASATYYSYEWNGATNKAPATISGRLFFRSPADSYDHFCSATAVNSAGKNMLFTAGHCVYTLPMAGAPGGFNTNVIFCPGYRNSSCPYGAWTAQRVATTNGWKNSGSLRYDMGVVLMAPYNGVQIVNWVGGAGITWNQAYSASTFWYAFGYPYNPWNGFGPWFPGGTTQNLWTCASYSQQWGYPATQYGAADNGPATIGIGCNMTGGASGGGWMRGSSTGSLNGVNSYKPTVGGEEQMFSPYFGEAAKNLYTTYQNG